MTQDATAPLSSGAPSGEIGDADGYDFGGAQFDLGKDEDREIVRFILSQALYGEATGVYCGKSLYAAGSLEAARFYVRQAKQELAHLALFADIFRALEMKPLPAHWVVRSLSSHNNYYPLKVLMEHAIGEGMVLDIFKDLLLQTLPDDDPRVPLIKKKLRVVCREEEEHVAWGEKETRRLLAEKPWLKTPYYGLLELQMSVLADAGSRLREARGQSSRARSPARLPRARPHAGLPPGQRSRLRPRRPPRRRRARVRDGLRASRLFVAQPVRAEQIDSSRRSTSASSGSDSSSSGPGKAWLTTMASSASPRRPAASMSPRLDRGLRGIVRPLETTDWPHRSVGLPSDVAIGSRTADRVGARRARGRLTQARRGAVELSHRAGRRALAAPRRDGNDLRARRGRGVPQPGDGDPRRRPAASRSRSTSTRSPSSMRRAGTSRARSIARGSARSTSTTRR